MICLGVFQPGSLNPEPLNLGPRIVYHFSISTNCLRSQGIDGEKGIERRAWSREQRTWRKIRGNGDVAGCAFRVTRYGQLAAGCWYLVYCEGMAAI